MSAQKNKKNWYKNDNGKNQADQLKYKKNIKDVEENWGAEKAPLWQYIIPPIFMTILTVIFYAPSMRYNFQFDDVANIQKFFHIRHYGLKDLFFSGTRWISYWLNTIHYSICKFDPISYRIGNLIFHIINGLLIFFILFTALRHLKNKNFFSKNYFSISLFTSILFLLHPVSTQTVSYVIQGQLEGLAALCIFSMTFLFLQFSYSSNKNYKIFCFISLIVIALLSCGTKEIAIISPALIILADWFLVAQGSWQSIKKRIYLHAIISFVVFATYLWFLKPTFFTEILGLQRVAQNNIGNVITENASDIITPWTFFISQFKVILHYLFIFIYPFNISVEYDWVLSKGFFTLDCILPLIALIIILSITLTSLIKSRANIFAFGALWFFVSIAPRSSIIPSPELLVDYKTYTASLGWLFLISCALIFLINIFTEKVILKIKNAIKKSHEPKEATKSRSLIYTSSGLAILLAVGAGFITIERNTIWRSGQEFWWDMIKHAPGKARAYNNYGVELSQNLRKFKEAIPYFKKAIEMDAKYPDPWNNVAVAYANINDLDNAISALNQSIKIYPYYPENYNNLASFYIQKNEFDKAEKLLKTAISLRPHYGKAYFNMGRIHFNKQEMEKAWENFKKCCTECDFDNVPHGFNVYGRLSMMLHKYDEAIFAYNKALQFSQNCNDGDFDPRDAAFNLANAYYSTKKYTEAITLYEKLVQQVPSDFRCWYNMGETNLELGRYEQALNCYQRAMPMQNQFPLINVRLANCLEKMGRDFEAKNVLSNFMQICQNNINTNNPAAKQMFVTAQNMLNKIEQKHTTA